MTLLKKISGIRGTIGGQAGKALTPIDIVEMVSGFGCLIQEQGANNCIVVGRDARISGEMVSQISIHTLIAMGFDVVDLGLSTTPTVEMAVKKHNAGGGIIFTASHNPQQWNALKLLNAKGEFISAAEGERMLILAEAKKFAYASVMDLGKYTTDEQALAYHISEILKLEYLDVSKIQEKNYKVVVDCINSTGAISLPPLFDALNVEYILINEEMNGRFAHDPEPLPKNLQDLSEQVINHKADLGIAVDPDVDRLVLVCGNGEMFGEEYTIVAAADCILENKKGPTVSNMSSSRALQDIAEKYGVQHYKSAVGEVNVVEKMKEVGAAIGGEGNGGVILPELHYGRDALVGIALILNLLARKSSSLLELKKNYRQYQIVKQKYTIDPDLNIESVLSEIKKNYSNFKLDETDGLRVDFPNSWVHLRKSNTEPVIRLIAEAETLEETNKLIADFEYYLKNLE